MDIDIKDLTDKDIEIILRALGKEKAFCENAGFHHLAHMVSDLQAHIKKQLPVVV
jgi:hypothetical protein